MDGSILNDLIEAIDLPHEISRQGLGEILKYTNKTPEAATIEDLREAAAQYLQDVFVELKGKV